MKVREATLQLPHLRLAIKTWGRADGLPVLAIHGWLDNAATFDRLAPLLPALQLVAVDLPGHGHSDHRPIGAGGYFPDWVADITAAIDALGWQQLVLLGHSMGAGIATLLAGIRPDRVQRLVLLEGLGPLTAAAEEAPERLARALHQEQRSALRLPRLLPSLEAAVAARMEGTDLDAESARLLVTRATAVSSDGMRFRHDPRLHAASRLYLTETQVLAFIERISCPVLVVTARNGWPFPPEQAAARLAAVRNLQQIEIEGGHHVHLTHPELVAPLVQRFLAGEPQPGGAGTKQEPASRSRSAETAANGSG